MKHSAKDKVINTATLNQSNTLEIITKCTNNPTTFKALKRNKLRYMEYYDMQDVYDYIYELGRRGLRCNDFMSIILDERNILLAYRTIKRNKGSLTKGTNQSTILDWEKATPSEYVNFVRKKLQNYNPQAIRRKYIPKANGKKRPLGIPTIEDRLIQQCIKQVLEPFCEARFYPHSYGFRPNRSTHHAIAYFQQLINLGKNYYVVDVDIKGFFDNIDHGKLLKQMWTLGIQDKTLLAIISKMLKAEIEGEGFPTRGTPQGGILSPLLANIVLNELDWWIDSQWIGFKSNYNYALPRNKYEQLQKHSKLKEVRIVRYADDFKIVCKKKHHAERIYKAVQLWLADRLQLEISPDKSGYADIRKQSIEFLGLKFKAEIKGFKNGKPKYVLYSHMTEKSIKNAKQKLKNKVIEVQKSPTATNVYLYNSTVLGLQNYYKIATHVNIDFGRIAYDIDKVIYNRLRKRYTTKGTTNKTYNKLYKNDYKKLFIKDICLFPIHDVQTKPVNVFTQEICDYTEQGRQLKHKKLDTALLNVIVYLMKTYREDKSVEFNDNRLSRYSGQKGLCYVTGDVLALHDMELHHIKPLSMGGTDRYANLVWVTSDTHKLIHATEEATMNKYLNKLNLDNDQKKRLNTLRLKVGNKAID